MLHVDINKLQVIIMLHVDIIYLACRGQKYATIVKTFEFFSFGLSLQCYVWIPTQHGRHRILHQSNEWFVVLTQKFIAINLLTCDLNA